LSDTDVVPAGDNLPATAADMGLDTGLEDFDTTDMVMPRLSIVHDEAKFEDNLTGERHEKLRVVILGLVKQRILWDVDVKDGEGPMCKSFNFREGVPHLKTFPLDASGFDALPQVGGTLPCDSCSLKDWGSHPQRETPWCSEQHTFPLLMQVGEDGPFSAPAMLTVQRSAIKASKSFLTGFARSKTPVFTVITELSLDPQKKGTVKYSVPRFVKVGTTEQEDWAEYADHYRTIRDFISTRPPDDGDVGGDDGPRTTAPAPSEAGAAAEDDDDLPF
jgi:hypothetical protein